MRLLAVAWCAAMLAGCAAQRVVNEGRHEAQLDGQTVAYSTRGRGEPAVVFVHGWSCDRSFFEAQMNDQSLAKGHRLIALDLPGHGESEPARGTYTCSRARSRR